jgi:hypothetical protein
MPVTLKKLAGDVQGGSPAPQMQPTPQQMPQQVTANPQTPPPANANSPPNWMMSGAALQAAAKAEADKAAANKAAYENSKDTMWRFHFPIGETRHIIFLDGDLNADGFIDARGTYEHSKFINGKWDNLVCLNGVPGNPPCPICELGGKDAKPALVWYLTVLNLTPYTINKGQNKGKVIQCQRQLFVAKQGTMEKLTFKAQALGGLTGKKFLVGRLQGQNPQFKPPSVGTEFEAIEAYSQQELVQLYGENSQPADYQKEIPFYTADQLIQMGVGKAPSGPGYEQNGAGKFDQDKLSSAL